MELAGQEPWGALPLWRKAQFLRRDWEGGMVHLSQLGGQLWYVSCYLFKTDT